MKDQQLDQPSATPEASESKLRRIRQYGRSILGRVMTGERSNDNGLKRDFRGIDNKIPATVEFFSEGQRVIRDKMFDPNTTLANIEKGFAHFTPEDAEAAMQATMEFVKILSSVEVTRDTIPLGEIDAFLAAYPANIIEGLGDQATPENLTTILHEGTAMAERHAQNPYQARQSQGYAARMAGNYLPRVVALHGIEALQHISALDQKGGMGNAEAYAKYRIRDPASVERKPFDDAAAMNIPLPESPFTRDDTEVWRGGGWMGEQQRPAEWGDLVALMKATGAEGREYGFIVAQDSDSSRLGFIRGGDAAVKNKNSFDERRQVFFHSHPSIDITGDGLYGPLVSPGDVNATRQADGGGGYYNVVCEQGLVLHVGSRRAEHKDNEIEPTYTVESGPLTNTPIVSSGTSMENSAQVLEALKATDQPYAYSITTPESSTAGAPNQLLFVVIPWKHLDATSISLQEVCHGDGLPRIIPAGLIERNEVSTSLHGALKKSKSLSTI